MNLNREELLKKQEEYEQQSQKYFEEITREIALVNYSNELIRFYRRVPIQMAKKRPDLWDVASELSPFVLEYLIEWIRLHDHNRKIKFWSVYVLPVLEKRMAIYKRGRTGLSEEYEKLKDKYPVDQLAEQYTKLGKVMNGKRKGLCPLHKDTDPSFTVYLESNSFYCFGCQQGGDTITLFRMLNEEYNE